LKRKKGTTIRWDRHQGGLQQRSPRSGPHP
jgi:hypothetical protein